MSGKQAFRKRHYRGETAEMHRDQRNRQRRLNAQYVERRLKTWGPLDAVLVDRSYGVRGCIKGDYSVVYKMIRVIAADTGEPMTSPDEEPLYLPDLRKGDRRHGNPQCK